MSPRFIAKSLAVFIFTLCAVSSQAQICPIPTGCQSAWTMLRKLPPRLLPRRRRTIGPWR